MAVVSGAVADKLDYHGLFAMEALIAAVSVFYVLSIFKKGEATR